MLKKDGKGARLQKPFRLYTLKSKVHHSLSSWGKESLSARGANLIAQQAQGKPNAKNCPKCGSIMRAGFVVEKDSPLSLFTAGSGIYWTPFEGGVMGQRVGLKAYACPACGYIEHYGRNLDRDLNTILSASTTFE